MKSFTVPLADFRQVADIAAKSAGTDKLSEVFTYIRFRVEGAVMTATATDRYTIATAKVAIEDAPDCEFFLTAAECAAIWRTFNPARRAALQITIQIIDRAVTVSLRSGLLRVGGDATLRFSGLDREWPHQSVDSLIAKVAAGDAAETGPLDSSFVRRLPAGTCQVKTTSNGVSGFFADAWVVLVMGKRAADGWSEAVLARWAS